MRYSDWWKRFASAMVILALCLTSTSQAQFGNLFGGGGGGGSKGSNPFGGSKGSNPFGGSKGSNPFGGSKGSNPFGGSKGSNPFGGSKSLGGFGNSSKKALGNPGKSLGNVGKSTNRSLGSVGKSTSKSLGNVGKSTNRSLGNVGKSTNRSLGNFGNSASKSLGNVGKSTSKSLGNVGKSTNRSLGNVGNSTSKSLGNVGKSANRSLGNVGKSANKSLGNVSKNTNKGLGNVGKSANNTLGNVGKSTSKRLGGLSTLDPRKITKPSIPDPRSVLKSVTGGNDTQFSGNSSKNKTGGSTSNKVAKNKASTQGKSGSTGAPLGTTRSGKPPSDKVRDEVDFKSVQKVPEKGKINSSRDKGPTNKTTAPGLRFQRPEKQKSDNSELIETLVEAFKNTAPSDTRTFTPRVVDPSPRRDQRPPRQVPMTSSPTPRPRTTAAAPRSAPKNAPPPKKPIKLQPNPVIDAPVAPLALTDATQEAVNEEAEEKIDELKTELDKIGLADDPDVKKAMQDALDKVANGELVTDADLDAIHAAIDEYAKKINSDPDKARQAKASVDKTAGALEVLSEIGALLQGDSGGEGLLVFNPDLNDNQVFTLPCGAVMCGGSDELTVEEGCLADVLGLPVGDGDAVGGDTTMQTTSAGVLITNPLENGVAVHYSINGHSYSMEPGYSQTLQPGAWTIEFDRGDGATQARYSLSDGTYAFGAGEQGWELFRQSFSVTVDNGENPVEFQYVVDNEMHAVEAGYANTHTSIYPIIVGYDRGDGGAPVHVKISQAALTLTVAVDAEDNLWGLYPSSDAAAADDVTEERFDAATSSFPDDGAPSRLERIRERVRQRQAQASATSG